MERRKPGPRPKGDRHLVNYRLPRHLTSALQKEAARRGMTATDLVGETLARELEVPYMDQEALPLSTTS